MDSDFWYDVTVLKMVATSSFHAEKCCNLVSAHGVYLGHIQQCPPVAEP